MKRSLFIIVLLTFLRMMTTGLNWGWSIGMMNINLVIPLVTTEHFMDALEQYLDEHLIKIGDFNCLMVESAPEDTMYLWDDREIVKVINIGTGA
jgi:hypothetical protein